MTNYKLHNDCKMLSQRVYPENRNLNTNGWTYKGAYSNHRNGFYSEVYSKGNKAILVFRGTECKSGRKEFSMDGYSDASMATMNLPYQMKDAERAYLETIKKYGKDNVVLTGHSLGGCEAQILGAKYGSETVTFAAYGTKSLSGVENNYSDNITNYGNKQDLIFMSNINNQIGKTLILESDIKSGKVTSINENFDKNNFEVSQHKLENLGDLSKGVEYKIANSTIFNKNNDDKAPLFKIGIQENVDLSEQDKKTERYKREKELFSPENRVFYDGEINPVKVPYGSDEDKYVPALLKQYSDNGNKLPSENELKQGVNNGDLIYVDDYVRQDGTHVSGYYRRK